MTNILLPRSTGLHYTLRSLVPRIPDLHLIDLTVVYPGTAMSSAKYTSDITYYAGIPPLGYGQSYYTLRSIFFDGVPPPSIHIHMRKFHVQQQVPIGDLSATNPKTLPDTSSQRGWLGRPLVPSLRSPHLLGCSFWETRPLSINAT